MIVADAGEPVLAPAIGARAGVIVREVVPGVAAFTVVLADGAPLTFAEIRAPALPGSAAGFGPGESLVLCCQSGTLAGARRGGFRVAPRCRFVPTCVHGSPRWLRAGYTVRMSPAIASVHCAPHR